MAARMMISRPIERVIKRKMHCTGTPYSLAEPFTMRLSIVRTDSACFDLDVNRQKIILALVPAHSIVQVYFGGFCISQVWCMHRNKLR